jgi:hypothetical protein
MNLVSGFVERRAYKLMGRKVFLTLFGWLGTIVHESGHALFCVIFGHRITAMKLFDPSHHGGSLGSVTHAFNPNNPYHLVGNFFIGIGPIILGAVVIYWSSRLLLGAEVTATLHSVQIGSDAFLSAAAFSEMAAAIWAAMQSFVTVLFSPKMLQSWQFYVFVYIAFSVGSSITLSKPDIQGAMRGFIALVVIVFAVQACTLWMGDYANQGAALVSEFSGPFYVVLLFALAINLAAGVLLFAIDLVVPG